MAGVNNKLYQLAIKIAGKLDPSLGRAVDSANGQVRSIGDKLKLASAIGVAALAALTVAVAAFGVAATKSAMEYEAQLANISTLLDGTAEQVSARTQEIGQDVLDISNRTGVATETLTDGAYQVISAFGDSADAMGILEVAAKSAAAGNATTTDSVNLLSAVTKGYGDTSTEAVQKASDLAFMTAKLGQTTFPELASSMGKVIPLASTLGINQEQLFGAMATLTGVTGNTAEVVTQLKGTVQGFLSPSANMEKALQKMGYSSGKALLESEGLQGALETLKKSVGGNDIEFAKLFSSVEAQTAVLAMAGTQAGNLTSKTAAMYEATGASATAFDRQAGSTEYMIGMIKNLGKNFQTSFGLMILPYVSKLLSSALPRLQAAIPAALEAISAICGVFVHGVLPVARRAISELVGAFAPIAESARLASTQLYNTFEKLLPALKAVGQFFVTNFMQKWRIFKDQIVPLLAKGIETIGGAVSSVVTTAAPYITSLVKAFSGISTRINSIISSLISKFKPVWEQICSLITGTIVPAINRAIETIAPVIIEIVQKIGPMITAIYNYVAPFIDTLVTRIQQALQIVASIFEAVAGPIIAVIQNILGALGGLIDFITGVFSGNWEQAWTGIKDMFGNIFGGILNLAKIPINGVIGAINGVINGINRLGFTLPEWLPPPLGGKEFRLNLPTIPALAQGGIATAPTLALIGEGSESEAVLPLSKLQGLLQERQESSAAPLLSKLQGLLNKREGSAVTAPAVARPQQLQERQESSTAPLLSKLQGLLNKREGSSRVVAPPMPELQELLDETRGSIVTGSPLAKLQDLLVRRDEAEVEIKKPQVQGGERFVFAPVINMSSKSDRSEVEQALGIAFEEFKKLMTRYEREQKRTKFA